MSYWDFCFIQKPDGTYKLHFNEGGGNWKEIDSMSLNNPENPYVVKKNV